MLRIRGEPGMTRYDLLIDEQVVIGWDNQIPEKVLKTMEDTTKSICK